MREIYGQVAYSLQKGDALAICQVQPVTTDNLKEYYDLCAENNTRDSWSYESTKQDLQHE